MPILAPTPSRLVGSSLEPWLSGTMSRSRSAWKRVATAHSTSVGLWMSTSSSTTMMCFRSNEAANAPIMTFLASPSWRFLILHIEMEAHHAAGRQMHVEHVREVAPQVVEQRRFLRDRAEQLMLQAAADDGVEDRVLAVRDRGDLHDMPLGAARCSIAGIRRTGLPSRAPSAGSGPRSPPRPRPARGSRW